MFTHIAPIDLSELVKKDDIVDNLVTSAADKVLSANQGVVLKALIDAKATPVSMSVVGTTVELVLDNGAKVIMDATQLLLDVKSMSGAYDPATQSLVVTLSDTNSFSIPVSALLPVVSDATIKGNGSGVPLGVAVSAEANNILEAKPDGVFVTKTIPSDHPHNGITLIDDRVFLEVLDEDDLHSESDTAVPSQDSVKHYVDGQFPEKKFLKNTGWTMAEAGKPTEAEAKTKVDGYKHGVMYYNGTDNPALKPTHTWWVGDDGEVVALGSQQDQDQNVTTSTVLIGQIFYDTDNTPTDGKLFQGVAYNWSHNPKLKAKFDANGHEFITDNGDGTFVIASHADFLRAGLANIGKHVDDTTAVNGLNIYTRMPKTDTYAAESGYIAGGTHYYPDRGQLHDIVGDTETAPDHRTAYFGIYGDLAKIVVPAVVTNTYTVVDTLTNEANEIPTTHAVKEAIPDAPVIVQIVDYKHVPVSYKSISTEWQQIANSFELTITPKYANARFRISVQWFGESPHTENLRMGLGVDSDSVNIEGTKSLSMPTKTYDYQINNDTSPEIGKMEYIYTSTTAAGTPIRFVPLMAFSSGTDNVITNRSISTGTYAEYGISTIIIEEIRA